MVSIRVRRATDRSPVRADEVADLWINLALPAAAVEDAVMPDTRLQMVGLFSRIEAMAQPMRRNGLADRADVVALALDGHQRGAFDRAGIDQFAAYLEAAMRQILALEHAI